MKIETLDKSKLKIFLNRTGLDYDKEADLSELFADLLDKAREFVPARAGVILMDNPIIRQRQSDPRDNDLVVIASFRDHGDRLIGKTFPGYQGRIGQCYADGEAYEGLINPDDSAFADLDPSMKMKPQYMVVVPIKIADQICGTLALFNKNGGGKFSNKEKGLLDIFADHISTMIVNVLHVDRFREISKLDSLTFLNNDRYFHSQLSVEIERSIADEGDLSLIFFDLDNFKSVNDNHGHLAGSMVLQEIARIMRRVVRTSAATMSRYGGDEYVVVLPGCKAEEAIEIGDAIRRGIESFTFLQTKGPYGPPLNIAGVLSCSLGVASFREELDSFEGSTDSLKDKLVKLADVAMYLSKESGKNSVAYNGKVVRPKPAGRNPD